MGVVGCQAKIRIGALWVKGKACANAVGVYNHNTITLLTANSVAYSPVIKILQLEFTLADYGDKARVNETIAPTAARNYSSKWSENSFLVKPL